MLQGKYEEAAAYIEKAYKLGRKVDEKDKENKELVRAEYGIVMANLVMHGVSQAMETTSQRNISKLLNWKQIRKDVFSNELPISNVCSNENLKDKNVGEIAACYSVQNDAKDNVEMSSNDTIP